MHKVTHDSKDDFDPHYGSDESEECGEEYDASHRQDENCWRTQKPRIACAGRQRQYFQNTIIDQHPYAEGHKYQTAELYINNNKTS
jgi:hypothetical protein